MLYVLELPIDRKRAVLDWRKPMDLCELSSSTSSLPCGSKPVRAETVLAPRVRAWFAMGATHEPIGQQAPPADTLADGPAKA